MASKTQHPPIINGATNGHSIVNGVTNGTPDFTNGKANGAHSANGAPNGTHFTKGATDSAAAHSRTGFKVGNFAIDEGRPLRVIVIGAGYSGIIAGIRLQQRLKNVELVIYEKQTSVGGAWFANRYPGLACDVPSHSYQLTFEPNHNWSAFYAPGPEIQKYLHSVADKWKLWQYMKLEHEALDSTWDETAGKWKVNVKSPQGEFTDVADFVINCIGGLSRAQWPNIDGLRDFQGTLVHSALWDLPESEDGKAPWEGKNVAVIGVGSSAVQLVPAIQPKVASLANFCRGKTWIAGPFASSEMKTRNPGARNHYFSAKEMKEFENTEYYKQFKRRMDDELNAGHGGTQRGHPRQAAAAAIKKSMIEKLQKKPWIAECLIPDFPTSCRRLTPGPGYLEALCQDNADFIFDAIKRVTKTGIETVDGQHRDFDMIICATGFDTTHRPTYPVIGRRNVNLQDKWKDHPSTYLAVAVDDFPNWFYASGPNSALGAGSLMVLLEREIEYIVKIIAKAQRERLKSVEVKKVAVDDFCAYMDGYFPQTVFTENCPSSYKKNGRVVSLWPGSALHAARAFEHPRWEDYNYEMLDDAQSNRLHWLGNGWTIAERDDLEGERVWYLDEIDYPPVPQ